MSLDHDSYLRAQRQYDNQLPPEEDDEEYRREKAEAYQEWLEMKADMAREDAIMELNDSRDIRYWERLEEDTQKD